MAEQKDFAYWRRKIEQTPDSEQLTGAVRAALETLLQRIDANSGERAELCRLILDFISRQPELAERKQRALKALAPFSAIRLAADKGNITDALKEPAGQAPAPAEEPPPADMTFDEAFAEFLCRFVRRKFQPFHAESPKSGPLPFVLSGDFTGRFEQAVREYFAPPMLKHRKVMVLSNSLGQDDYTEEVFSEIFNKPKKENAIRLLWEERWDNLGEALGEELKAAPDMKPGKGKLLGKFGRKKDPKAAAAAIRQKQAEEARQLWELLQGDGGYDPPKADDIALFRHLFAFDIKVIADSMHGVKQTLEYEDSGEADEGASRKYMCGRLHKCPDFLGEMVVLWAYYACSEVFTKPILESFQASQGSTPGKRRRKLPLFLRWVPDVVKVPGAP